MNDWTVIKIECDEVICDRCDMDFTDRDDEGGAVSFGRAYCPKCWKESVAEYGMPKTRTIVNMAFVPFRTFIKVIREKSS